MNEKQKLGELLLKSGLVSIEQLNSAFEEQKKTHEKLGKILVRSGIVSAATIGRVLEKQLDIPYINLENYSLDSEIISLLPEEFIRTNLIIPLKKIDSTLEVACVPPMNPIIINNARLITGLKIKSYLITEVDFEQALDKIYNFEKRAENVISTLGGDKQSATIIPIIKEISNGEAPIVGLVNSIFSDAIAQGASDIHFDPTPSNTKVRYRIDGVMYNSITIPKEVAESVISRIKVSSGIDIAERRRPQDGHFSAEYRDEPYDFRVVSMGSYFGEKLAVRILSKQKMLMPLERLGMLPGQFKIFKKLIKKPYGVILVTGPTGSGKTTTLYSALSTINTGTENIITLEDPVEYNIPGVVQVQINEEAGITFSSGLRSILRLDPNIIMVGEIRDLETAKVVIEASLTGHLVLASIHTNDAASTPVRLLNLGVEPYLIASSLIGVVAQRLVRIICPNCKYSYVPAPNEISLIRKELEVENVKKLQKGQGCALCNFSRYKGRTGIFEILEVDKEIQELLVQQSATYASYEAIKGAALKNGMITLREAGFQKVIQGITTIEEAERVVTEI
jgi:type IV pilus assembly protein PilB